MEDIDAALRSLEDSMDRLATRLRSTGGEVMALFRLRIVLDDRQAAIAAGRANGLIDGDWGRECVLDVNAAAMLVAAVPANGGQPFAKATKRAGKVLATIGSELSDDGA